MWSVCIITHAVGVGYLLRHLWAIMEGEKKISISTVGLTENQNKPEKAGF